MTIEIFSSLSIDITYILSGLLLFVLIAFYVIYMRQQNKKKYIIFDLDETLGHFSHFSVFLHILQEEYPEYKQDKKKYELLDLFPETFRVNIFSLLELIARYKKTHSDLQVILFTNNQGDKSWYTMIVDYIHKKMKYKLFDTIVGPYMIGNKHIEKMRTSHDKRIEDLIKGNVLPKEQKNVSILFFDDQKHQGMRKNNVSYYLLERYLFHKKFTTMYRSFINKTNKPYSETLYMMCNEMDKLTCPDSGMLSRAQYIEETKQMITYTKKFLQSKHKKSRKLKPPKQSSKSKTRKQYV